MRHGSSVRTRTGRLGLCDMAHGEPILAPWTRSWLQRAATWMTTLRLHSTLTLIRHSLGRHLVSVFTCTDEDPRKEAVLSIRETVKA